MFCAPRSRSQIPRALKRPKGKKTPSTLSCKPRAPYRHHIVLEQLCRRGAQLALADCLNVWRLLRGEGRGGVVTRIQGFWKGTERQTDRESSRAPRAPSASPSPAVVAQEGLEGWRGTWRLGALCNKAGSLLLRRASEASHRMEDLNYIGTVTR